MEFNFTLTSGDAGKGPVTNREAVRAVVIRGGSLLLVRSKKGDLKFPGGGVEAGENHKETLCREVREETGYCIGGVQRRLGVVVERRPDAFEKGRIFQMISVYYLCELAPDRTCGMLELDSYEAALGLQPEWIQIAEAHRNNEKILQENPPDMNQWVVRETLVLQRLVEISI